MCFYLSISKKTQNLESQYKIKKELMRFFAQDSDAFSEEEKREFEKGLRNIYNDTIFL